MAITGFNLQQTPAEGAPAPSYQKGKEEEQLSSKAGEIVQKNLNYSKELDDEAKEVDELLSLYPTAQSQDEQKIKNVFSQMLIECNASTMHVLLYGHVLNKNSEIHPHIDGGLNWESNHLAIALNVHADSLEPSSREYHFFKQCASELNEAVRINERAFFAADSLTEDSVANEVYDKIQQLQPGQSYVIHGGWLDHSVAYAIESTGAGFILTIINTGEDEKSARAQPDEQGRYEHKAFNLAGVSQKLVKALIFTRTNADRSKGETLAAIDDICLNELEGQPWIGRLHKGQERRNCVQKRDKSWFREKCLKEFGSIEGNRLYEKFKIAYNKQLMEEVNEIESTYLSSEQLRQIYDTPSYKVAMFERQAACHQTIQRQENKLNRFSIYDALKAGGWDFTDDACYNELVPFLQEQGMESEEITRIVALCNEERKVENFFL